MADTEVNTSVETGTSRRALLGKAAAAGAIAYAVPMIKSVPAYAANGLSSCNDKSSQVCVWFSPAQNSKLGKWSADIVNTTDGIVSATNSGTTQTMTIDVRVAGTNRGVRFTGAPVNIGNSLGLEGSGSAQAAHYGGGGVYIESLDSNCQIDIKYVLCRKQDKAPCETTNETTNGPASWAVGSSDNPINSGAVAPNENVGSGSFQTAYYHSGRTGADGSGKCRVSFLFEVCCK